jgi:hypothetical protein
MERGKKWYLDVPNGKATNDCTYTHNLLPYLQNLPPFYKEIEPAHLRELEKQGPVNSMLNEMNQRSYREEPTTWFTHKPLGASDFTRKPLCAVEQPQVTWGEG